MLQTTPQINGRNTIYDLKPVNQLIPQGPIVGPYVNQSIPKQPIQAPYSNPSATSPERDKFVDRNTQTPTSIYGGQPNTPSGATVGADGKLVSGQGGVDTPQAPSPADTAFASYLDALNPSQATTDAQRYVQELTTKSQLANEKALGSGDTLGFAAGEAQRVGRNFDIKIAGAAAIADMQANLDANRQNISKARYEYEQKKIDDAKKEVDTGFELSPGQSRFDSTGKVIASLAPKPTAPKGNVTSGGLTYSSQSATEDSQILEQSRGTDGFVNSGTYKQLYDAWIANGGLLKDFLNIYNPKNYTNPNDTTLPAFLRPKADSADELINAINAAFPQG